MDSAFTVDGPVGRIEAREEAAPETARGVVVLAHPHPLYGGSMEDAVLAAVRAPLVAGGMTCIRYNMRGVGGSEGKFDDGNGEADDLLAMVADAHRRHPQLPLYVVGYSFGAAVVNRVIAELGAAAVAFISPPVGHMDFDIDAALPCPVHVLVGDDDDMAPAEIVASWAENLPQRSTVQIIEGADHVFTQGAEELAERVSKLLESAAPE